MIRFKAGWGAGGLRLRRVPAYSMPYWRRNDASQSRIEFRPSAKTWFDQLGITGIAVVLLAGSVWLAGVPWSPVANDRTVERSTVEDVRSAAVPQSAELQTAMDELKRRLPPEKLADLERLEQQRRSEREATLARLQSQRSILTSFARAFHSLAFAFLAAVAVLPLLSLPIQKVVIEKSPEHEMVIRRRGLWPSTRRWPRHAFDEIVYGVEEDRRRWRRTSYTAGWKWIVSLRGQASNSHESAILDCPEVSFYVDRQRQKPGLNDESPEIVTSLATALSRLTGATIETVKSDPTSFNRRRVTTTRMTPIESREVSIPWDELPDDLRRIASEMRDKGETGPTLINESVRITVRDADGNERTYNSLDELPAELQTEYEKALRTARRQ